MFIWNRLLHRGAFAPKNKEFPTFILRYKLFSYFDLGAKNGKSEDILSFF